MRRNLYNSLLQPGGDVISRKKKGGAEEECLQTACGAGLSSGKPWKALLDCRKSLSGIVKGRSPCLAIARGDRCGASEKPCRARLSLHGALAAPPAQARREILDQVALPLDRQPQEDALRAPAACLLRSSHHQATAVHVARVAVGLAVIPARFRNGENRHRRAAINQRDHCCARASRRAHARLCPFFHAHSG